jgi:hypothetical protein
MSGHTWMHAKYQAARCTHEVVVDHGPNYCPRFVSKHLTEAKAQAVADRLNALNDGKKYKVIPV